MYFNCLYFYYYILSETSARQQCKCPKHLIMFEAAEPISQRVCVHVYVYGFKSHKTTEHRVLRTTTLSIQLQTGYKQECNYKEC